MDFEWDEEKRRGNVLNHGIDFADAIEMFAGHFIEAEDGRRDYGEQRDRAVGRVDEIVIQVAYTWRGAAPDHQCQKGRTK